MATDVYVPEGYAGDSHDDHARPEGRPDGQESPRGTRHKSGYRDDAAATHRDDDPKHQETANDDGTGPEGNACNHAHDPEGPGRASANQDDRSRR